MTKLMLASVFDTFRAADVPDDKARAATKNIAGYDNPLNSIEQDLDAAQGEANLHRWMLGACLAISSAIFARPTVG